jgi:MFS family permease
MPPLPELPAPESPPATDTAPSAVDASAADTMPEEHTPEDVGEDMALPAATETGFWPVLRNRNFLFLWSGQIFSQIADKFYIVLMIYVIASRFAVGEGEQSITAWATPIYVVNTIPAMLFGSLAGAWTDRWRKQSVMVWSNLLRGGMVFALPWLVLGSEGIQGWANLPLGYLWLLAITFFESTLTQFFAPAEQAAIPLIVDQTRLLPANSLYTATMMVATIIGFAAGEPVLGWIDDRLNQWGIEGGEFLLVAACYTLAGLILWLPRIREQSPRSNEDSHFWTDMREGLDFLQRRQSVRNALLQLVLLYSLLAALYVLALSLATGIPGLGAKRFGILLAASGLGLGLGAFLVGQFGQSFPRRRLTQVGLFGLAACLLLLALVKTSLWPTLIAITLLGSFAALIGIPAQTIIQEETPEQMRGKVFGIQNNAVNIALSLPLALAGILVSLIGLSPTLIGLSAITALSELLAFRRPRSAP